MTISRQVSCSPETLKRKLDNIYTIPEQKDSSTESQRFVGPTSSAFGFGVATNSLQTMNGQHSPIRPDSHYLQENIAPSESPNPVNPQAIPGRASSDPLLEITPEETKRLLDVYDDELQYIYPLVDIEAIRAIATALHTHIEISRKMGVAVPHNFEVAGLEREDVDILKMVLANALFVDGRGQSDLVVRLYQSVKGRMDSYTSTLNIGVKALMLIVLVVRTTLSLELPILTFLLLLRVNITFFKTKKFSPGGLLGLLLGPLKSLDYISGVRWSNDFHSPTDAFSPCVSSGPSTHWIGDGVSAQAFRSHLGILTLITLCPSL